MTINCLASDVQGRRHSPAGFNQLSESGVHRSVSLQSRMIPNPTA